MSGAWNDLVFGSFTAQQIHEAVKDPEWQEFRVNLLGTTMNYRRVQLHKWMCEHSHSHEAQIQVTNYVNALKRGGLI